MIIGDRIPVQVQAGFPDELHDTAGSQACCPAVEQGTADGGTDPVSEGGRDQGDQDQEGDPGI